MQATAWLEYDEIEVGDHPCYLLHVLLTAVDVPRDDEVLVLYAFSFSHTKCMQQENQAF